MTIDEKFMHRCLQIARNGLGFTHPNPLVGAVVVCDGKIIGEGFHRKYGEAHAEVNAIASVKDKSLLSRSTIYVSLEPCAHHGKTPPCASLIIQYGIPRVVIACLDPYPAVSGRGLQMLQDAGIDVTVGVLREQSEMLNKEFFTLHTKDRPYIYLKWAQTKDGFIDKERVKGELPCPTPISNYFTRMLVHKTRAEVGAIMIGTNTAINDNPSLTTRFWYGNNPVRIILDRTGRIPQNYHIFDRQVSTIVFTEQDCDDKGKSDLTYVQIPFDDSMFDAVFKALKARKINSILVEGGNNLLNSFITKGMWDEAFIEISDIEFRKGVRAPHIDGQLIGECFWKQSRQLHLKPNDYKNV